jgi:hypothetical protein
MRRTTKHDAEKLVQPVIPIPQSRERNLALEALGPRLPGRDPSLALRMTGLAMRSG